MKMSRLPLTLLMLGSVCVHAADADTTQLSHARTPIARPSFYDPFGGDFFVQLDGFVYGLFLSQTHDSTRPVEINDVPLVTLNETPGAYDWLLQP